MRRPDGATKTALKIGLRPASKRDLGAFVSGPFSMTSKPIAGFSIKPKINAEQKIWSPNTLTEHKNERFIKMQHSCQTMIQFQITSHCTL